MKRFCNSILVLESNDTANLALWEMQNLFLVVKMSIGFSKKPYFNFYHKKQIFEHHTIEKRSHLSLRILNADCPVRRNGHTCHECVCVYM